MNEKKNLVNPPIQGSILDSMNPASRAGLVRKQLMSPQKAGFQKATEIHQPLLTVP